MNAIAAEDSILLGHLERILHERIGLDVTTVGSSLVQRAVMRRISACGARGVAEYVDRIGSDEHELQELVEAVVIPETYFFREPDALDAVARMVAKPDTGGSATSTVHVLSAPCSTGEEPYSIAMSLLAAGVPPSAIAIDAVDVSREAVRRARLAVYRATSFRGGTFDWTPYFSQTSTERALHAEVRDLVRVEHGNLLDPAFRPPRSQYDVIFCRNLLIYFDGETQARVLATLGSLLTPAGILVVGAADTFAVRRAGFGPMGGAERSFLFQRLGEPHQSVRNAQPDSRPAMTSSRVVGGRRASPKSAQSTPIKRPTAAPTAGRVPRAATARPQPVERAFDVVARLADEGRLADAVRVGEAALEASEASADLLTLLGTSYGALDDSAGAERSYRRALYLDPSHAEALLHLALLLDGRGDGEAALRLRARARRQIAGDRGAGA